MELKRLRVGFLILFAKATMSSFVVVPSYGISTHELGHLGSRKTLCAIDQFDGLMVVQGTEATKMSPIFKVVVMRTLTILFH